jgi:glycosyltransferase involved in cell wall biosynthesis
MKVAFHSRLVTERGSEAAMLDYARLNRSVLKNESILCFPDRPEFAKNPILKKWQAEFPVILYQDQRDLGKALEKEDVKAIYLTKPGFYDAFLVPDLKNCIHAQFLSDEFHGDVYAYLSPWMSRVMTGGEDSYVPFYVPQLKTEDNLRKKLGISREARVFGRHGGWDTFNIPFARKVVAEHAHRHPEDHFVFLNTKPIRGTEKLPNVHYLSATVDANEKAAFFATCDAMIHARDTGETFGLAVAEFAVLAKPVITFEGSKERAHLEMLGDQALLYRNPHQLTQLLQDFQPHKTHGTAYELFADPKVVMDIFEQRYLDGMR